MVRKLLVIATDPTVAERYERTLRRDGYDVCPCTNPAGGVHLAVTGDFDVILAIQSTPDFDPLGLLREIKAAGLAGRVVILSRHPSVEAAVAAMREGAHDYRGEPDAVEDLHSVLARLSLSATASAQASTAKNAEPPGFEGMLGQCLAIREVFALIQRIAPSDSTVLITGESGTGKELVAQAIHRHSRRTSHPLLACDCTALAPTLLESELFGHVKGSFSGAITAKKGLFEVAHQGTLFLDEVSNLSMETQGKLLRVLETRQVRKVGDTAEHEVDIRLIATTNRNLAEMVKVGGFRADLYYRLNVVPISLPALRERPGDVYLLAQAFLNQFSQRMAVDVKGFSPEAVRQLETYPWPGNVRELRNIVERLSVLYGGSRIELQYLPVEIREAEPTVSADELPFTWEEFRSLKRRLVEDLECRFLAAALERCAHNVTQAAESVGMQRPNFHALLRAHGLKPESTRSR
jgi:DNA-binding NtrC family response regulator